MAAATKNVRPNALLRIELLATLALTYGLYAWHIDKLKVLQTMMAQ